MAVVNIVKSIYTGSDVTALGELASGDTVNLPSGSQLNSSNILISSDIGTTVQGYDADTAKYDDTTANFTGTLQNGGSNVVVDSDIGSTVQAYDAGLAYLDGLNFTDEATFKAGVNLEIGVDVQAYDATILKSSDIGSTVQGYDADTAKYDDVTSNFTGTLQNGGSNVVVDSDIGSTVQAYDATILKSADIGSTVQAYDADTAKYDDVTANFSGTLQQNGVNVVTTSGSQTLTNKTITNLTFDGNYTEEVVALGTSGTLNLEPDNGTIQTCALSGNPTFTDGLSAGQSLVLMLTNGASYTVTFPTMTWVGSGGNVAPTLTAGDVIVFWKVSTTLYGAWVGSAV